MGPSQSGCQTALIILTIGTRWRLSSHHQAERHRPHPLLGANALQTVHNPARIPPQCVQLLKTERMALGAAEVEQFRPSIGSKQKKKKNMNYMT